MVTHTLCVVNVDVALQYDLKNERKYLRRVKVDDLSLCDIRVGGYITVLSRRLKVVDYARVSTRQHFTQHKKERYSDPAPESGDKIPYAEYICGLGHVRYEGNMIKLRL